jgi:phospholipase/carboxylesterase
VTEEADASYSIARLTFRPRPARGDRGPRDESLGLDDTRDGWLYVPETAESSPPLFVYLHGATGTGRSHGRAVLAAADRYGVAVVAPDSRHVQTWDLIAARAFGPDVAHLDRVLDAVVDQVDVDTSRIAIGGVSDGASYALSLGLSNGDVFTTVVAYSPGFLAVAEPNGRPRVFVSHGTSDPILPFEQCSGTIVPMLRQAGYEVEFDIFDGGHTVPPPVADAGVRWWLEGDAQHSQVF